MGDRVAHIEEARSAARAFEPETRRAASERRAEGQDESLYCLSCLTSGAHILHRLFGNPYKTNKATSV